MSPKVPAKWMVLAVAATGAVALAACSSGSPTATSAPPTATAGSAPQGAVNLVSVATDGGKIAPLQAAAASQAVVGSSQQMGVFVNGSGSVFVTPDVGVLSFGVESRAPTVAPARDEAAKAMDAAIKALKALGVQDKDIKTQQVSIQPVIVYKDTSNRGGGTPEITGYIVTNSATAKVRDLAKFGDSIDAVAKAAGNNIRINFFGFDVDDPKPAETQARDLALKDAQAKAQQIAKTLGFTLGKPLYVSDSGGSPLILRNEKVGVAGAAAPSSAPTPISPGQSQVSISVQVVFAIQ